MVMLGRLKLENPYMFAPMSMYSDVAFRRLCADYGCSHSFTEQIFASEFVKKSKKLKKKLDLQKPCGIQFLTNSPDELKKAIEMIKNKEFYPGLENITSIDLNLGCPSPIIRKKNLGARLLKENDLIEELFTTLKKYSHVPVSAKIRLAENAKHMKAKPYLRIAKLAEKCGLDFITVHGRVASQMYEGNVDYKAMKELANSVNIPVVGNGDITDLGRAKKMLTYCKAIMIGRQALKEPFIFGIIQNKEYETEEEKLDCVVKYLEYAEEYNVGFQQIKIHIQSLLKDTIYVDFIDDLTHLKDKVEINMLIEDLMRFAKR